MHVNSFIESIVRKVALIRCSPRLTSYAGMDLKKKDERAGRMPGVRSALQRITGLPGQLQPDDDVGLFIACLSALRALAERNALISRQRFEHRINVLQNGRLALLAPIQGDHLLVRLDLVDIGWQFFEMIEQGSILTYLLPLIHPHTR
jgi:hypothetical protein